MAGTKEKNKHIALFEGNKVRRVWYDEKWFFVVEDVVFALIDSKNVKDYINKIRQRDPELSKGYGQFVHTLDVPTKGGIQSMNCADLEGIFRIIQSISSPKAEPFKQWLAKVGKERVDEIQNPELAMERMKSLYEQKGYPDDWVSKRMRGIAVRNTLTDEWNKRGLKKGVEYAILTNEIMQGTFDMKVDDYKKHKNLSVQHNLRDHMGDIELILTMLAEATTTKLSVDRDSEGFNKLHKDAKEGGEIAGNTRKEIETRSGKKIRTKNNFLNIKNKKKLK
ncbi:MAG: Bro-N domain-containing protein [Candidatus Parcubacteria bacterium]|nr:Bro-N domain-containing protein [Candidatus Parcubacteria bacterium]